MTFLQNEKLSAAIASLQTTWHEQIPITRYMALEIKHANQTHIVLTAPVAPNINVHQTMFAGSIYTLATLCGWGAIHLAMKNQQVSGDIVLSSAEIDYKKPITKNPIATADWGNIDLDYKSLTNKMKVKITIAVELNVGNEHVATFHGVYVILPKD